MNVTMKAVLFCVCIALFAVTTGVLSLTVYADNDQRTFSGRTTSETIDSPVIHPERTKRTTPSPQTSNFHGSITSKVIHLNETREQLMVHWVGENSNVIICLAHEGSPSTAVYISYDYGDTYINKTDEFKIDSSKNLYASIDKFYIHPTFKSYCVYTDVLNHQIFTTIDHSLHIHSNHLSFVPSEVTYRPDVPFVFVIHDKVSPTKQLWITHDFGKTWTMLEEHVRTYFWIPVSWDLYKHGYSMIIQREESPTTSVVIAVSENINSGQNNLSTLAVNILQLEVKDDYMFITTQFSKHNLDLWISYKGGNFVRTNFDTELDRRDYYIADITANRIMVAIAHNRTFSSLYISDIIQASNQDTILFSLSLESVVAYFPNISWTESLLSDFWTEPFVDLHKVEGLQGIYIASHILSFMPKGTVDLDMDYVITLITFDWGSTWGLLNITRAYNYCYKIDSCTLHLTQMLTHVYPVTRTHAFILSSKSAPGIIMATGVIGRSLKGHPGVFISRDAGLTWQQTLDGLYFYNIGDHGGILTAVQYYKNEKKETSDILYSTDEGETWHKQNFTNSKIKVYDMMIEPGKNTTVFTMFGSVMEKHEWLLVKIDLKNAFSYNCTKDDYKLWSPTSSKNHLKTSCILGQTLTFQRRSLKANCYNGLMNYEQPIQSVICDCDVEDFTCDHGFTLIIDSKQCVRSKTSNIDPYVIPSFCKPGLMYNHTKGYRLIPGNMCKRGRLLEIMPQEVPCPFKEKAEFILVAQKERILRMNLYDKQFDVLPIFKLENVIAVEFDVKNNCVYWADIVTDIIGRQCLSGGKDGPEILLNTGLGRIEGMAYDWMSQNLYFVDGAQSKIEVIHTNLKIPGHMRRTILNSTYLKRPRGIAVHPRVGYLFWTDWAVGKAQVARANLDGSDVKVLIKKDIEWPNGLTVDYIDERLFWVDARRDYIASCDLHGNDIKKFLKNDEKISHPFAVAVLKDWIYWDDWKQSSIFMSDKNHGAKIQTIASHLPGLKDLKVFSHMSQINTNACSNNNSCSHFCFGLPNQKFTCQCPDNMSKSEDSCLCPGLIEPFENGTCPSVGQTCSVDYFQCSNGNCIPKYWQCDGDNDCEDASDEANCTKIVCSSNSFQCNNGKCIPSYWTCDFDHDCEDGSDELNCKYPNCSDGQFRCKNGRCIRMNWRCDLEDDCHDQSDEVDCPNISSNSTECPPGKFRCPGSTNICIPAKWLCDGQEDCPDGKDEINCDITNCETWQFECANKKCIFGSWKCDGDDDCNDGLKSDEVNCSTVTRPYHIDSITSPPFITNGTCSEWLFQCSNGKCIPYWWKCDKVMDCDDGSDEEQCGTIVPTVIKTNTSLTTPKTIVQCPQHHFQCNSGLCIEDSWVCDEIFDCDDGEDETNCKKNNFVGRCKNNKEFKCRISGSCININKVCDGTPQCPDASDEMFCQNNNKTQKIQNCGVGLFECDGGRKCLQISKQCDLHEDCYDGTDEKNCGTKTNSFGLQVKTFFVRRHETTSDSLSLFWFSPKNLSLEYLPSISESSMPNSTVNKTWISNTSYKFTSLKPFTLYNMTVFTRQKNFSDIYSPGAYILALTSEGVPNSPFNVTVKEVNAEEVLVTWTKPENPSGHILSYNIYVEPPHPALVLTVEADNENATQSYPVQSFYSKNIEYSFWVTAKSSEFESERSTVKKFHFDEDSLVDVSLKINVTSRTENSITISWKSVEHVDGFNIVSYYPMKTILYPNSVQSFNVSNGKNVLNFTINNLSPGIFYRITVLPYNKRYIGMKSTIMTKTIGKPLPSVSNITGSLVKIKDKKSTIQVQWIAPKQMGKSIWLYGVYYGTNINELLSGPKYNTSETTIFLRDIESCTSLVIDVGIIGTYGIGPLSMKPLDITTPFDPTIPPKDIQVEEVEHSFTFTPRIIISWKSYCHADQQSYKVTILESTRNETYEIVVSNVRDGVAETFFNINNGGNYFIRVSTIAPNAVPSPMINYRAPELPSPHQVKVFVTPQGHYKIEWRKPKLPYKLGILVHYLIHMSEGSELNVTSAQTYISKDTPYILADPPRSSQLSVAVQLVTNNGYVSQMSEVFSFIPQNAINQSQNIHDNIGWTSIILVLLVIGLSAGLVYFVVRYRNLQNSFMLFANSRYHRQSGTATFTGVNSPDDEPVVQIFSDDEPLVIT